jgi:hypothetical protein
MASGVEHTLSAERTKSTHSQYRAVLDILRALGVSILNRFLENSGCSDMPLVQRHPFHGVVAMIEPA